MQIKLDALNHLNTEDHIHFYSEELKGWEIIFKSCFRPKHFH